MVFGAAAGLLLAAGCDDSGGGGKKDGTAQPDPGEPPGSPHILVIGDGISKGVGLGPDIPAWPKRLRYQLDGVPVTVAAQGGAETDYGAAHAEALIAQNEPSHLLILLGSNEVDDDNPPDAMQANYQTMIDAAQAADVTPIIATLPPAYGLDNTLILRGMSINRMIRALAAANGIAVADLEQEFGTDRSLLQADGLHPTAEGHVIIMAAFYDLL